MWKKVVTVGLLLAAGAVAVKYSSAAGTLWQNLCKSASQQVPRDFKIDEIRYQITQYDTDIDAARLAIAEKKADRDDLRRELQTARATLAKQGKELEALAGKVETGTGLVGQGTDRADRTRMTRELRRYQETKALVAQKEKHLEALEGTIAEALQALAQMETERAEFARELAEVERREQQLKQERATTSARKGSGSSAQIRKNLAAVKREQAVETYRNSPDLDADSTGDTHEQTAVQATPEDVRRALNPQPTEPAPKGGKKTE
jgi:chromosome segregation ATPase